MADLLVTGVTKSYPTRAEPLEVLRGVTFELSAGENLAILGPSGCGKSTLLYIIGTLDAPTSGRVSLGGSNPFELSEPRLAAFRNHKIGFVFQDHYLLPQCSVLDNVLVPTLADGRPTRLVASGADSTTIPSSVSRCTMRATVERSRPVAAVTSAREIDPDSCTSWRTVARLPRRRLSWFCPLAMPAAFRV